MGASWRGVLQLVVDVTIEAVGSVLGLLLWKLITHVVKLCRQGAPQALPLLPLTGSDQSDFAFLQAQSVSPPNNPAQNLEREASDAAREAVGAAVAVAVLTTSSSSPTESPN